MKKLACAIYTRKSSEEGLDQSFNSLDAQRSACEAYIASQAGEGWVLHPEEYDDGGWSGGNMERPGLQRLLRDIAKGRIDIVVVYKVDRLTRSLADFARMVDVLDRHGSSFVSVTQAFNTTTSMGRLTLNVLLSFAQFEREVTGERIRDKIAASKERGIWMGGNPPLGYDARDRMLAVNEGEADVVRRIFSRYLELGSVNALARELQRQGVRSKQWTSRGGKARGGAVMNSGALSHLLRNRIYVGETVHGKRSYPGQHDAIIDRSTFDAVQAQLANNRLVRSGSTLERAPLTGLLFDMEGNRMSPAHTRNRYGIRYLYYVSSPLQKGGTTAPETFSRVAARDLEEAVFDRLRRWSGKMDAPRSELAKNLRRIIVRTRSLTVEFEAAEDDLPPLSLHEEEIVSLTPDGSTVIESPVLLGTRGGATTVMRSGASVRSRPNKSLISALRKAHAELGSRNVDLTVQRFPFDEAKGIDDPYLRKLTTIAFLAPDIQRAILEGRQPPGMTLHQLTSEPLPLDWNAQRARLGFATI